MVDTGLMRKNEFKYTYEIFKKKPPKGFLFWFFSRFALRENKGLVRFLAGKYMSDKLMMTIARTINDVVLVVLKKEKNPR